MEAPKYEDLRDDWKMFFSRFMDDSYGIAVEKVMSMDTSISKRIGELSWAHERGFTIGTEYIKYGIACGAITQEHIDMWREQFNKEKGQPND